MAPKPLHLILLADTFAVVRLPADAVIPAWVAGACDFMNLTRTSDELSIAAAERLMPDTLEAERGFRALKVAGPLAFSQVGILASIASTLAGAGVSIFVVSTYETDYVLVKNERLDAGIAALRYAGHTVSTTRED